MENAAFRMIRTLNHLCGQGIWLAIVAAGTRLDRVGKHIRSYILDFAITLP